MQQGAWKGRTLNGSRRAKFIGIESEDRKGAEMRNCPNESKLETEDKFWESLSNRCNRKMRTTTEDESECLKRY